MTKTVFFDARGRVHSLFKEFIEFPPEGYRFVLNGGGSHPTPRFDHQTIFSRMRSKLHRSPYSSLLLSELRYATGDSLLSKPVHSDITFSPFRPVYRKEKWVAFIEHLGGILPSTYDISNLNIYRKFVSKVLSSKNCKKIVPYCGASERTLLNYLDSRKFRDKVQVVHLAVRPKHFEKKYTNDVVRFLFLGTVNYGEDPGTFTVKGGKETLEAFGKLNEIYGQQIELLMRCRVPSDAKAKYRRIVSLNNVKIIESPLSSDEFARLVQATDIYMHPGHITPAMAFLDAMSYELPIIATDVFSSSEMVSDGLNGFLVKAPFKVDNFVAQWSRIDSVNQQMIDEIVAKARILIDDSNLRRRMGREGRKRVEYGEFSIGERNRKLKRIFDEASA
jgi:glycosyltransferase involved in cell wall biosynthesis